MKLYEILKANGESGNQQTQQWGFRWVGSVGRGLLRYYGIRRLRQAHQRDVYSGDFNFVPTVINHKVGEQCKRYANLSGWAVGDVFRGRYGCCSTEM